MTGPITQVLLSPSSSRRGMTSIQRGTTSSMVHATPSARVAQSPLN